jgi:Spy/CpxP family protein refolding chaperone
MRNTKMMVAVATVAVLLMAAAVHAEPGKGGPGFGHGHGKWAAIMNELTPEQQTQMKALKIEGLKKHEEFRSQIAKKRIELMELASKDNPDEQVLVKKQQEIWALKDQARNDHRAMKLKFRALLTPEQRQKLGPLGFGMGMGRGMGKHGGMCGMCGMGGFHGGEGHHRGGHDF